MPLLPRANKSALTSLLEREPVMSPKYQWNLLEPLRSLEIVWGNGDEFWSGSGVHRGEGPGPSMKGVAKGFLGAKGAMGVFTKCAIKLFAWPRLSTLLVEGIIPAYKTSLPDNFKAYTVAFPSWKAWADAAHLIWETDLGYLAHRQFNMFGMDLKYAMVKSSLIPPRHGKS
jgi:hypothetical protein